MEKCAEQGMQTFDRVLLKPYKAGKKIKKEEALKDTDSRNKLRLKITLDHNKVAKQMPIPTSMASSRTKKR